MNAPYGCYELGGIEGLREKFPIVLGVDKVDAIIPFNSEIKFNCIKSIKFKQVRENIKKSYENVANSLKSIQIILNIKKTSKPLPNNLNQTKCCR